MFLSKSLVALLVLAITATSITAHPSPEHLHNRHRRIHARPRAVVKRRSCTAPGQHPFSPSISSISAVSTSSTAAPAKATPDSPKPISGNPSFAALVPIGGIQTWSTSSSAPKPLALSDATFRLTDLLSALPHPYVNAPDGEMSLKATYPEGSYNFQHQPLGGLSFYAPGPANVDLTTAKEITFGYSVYFEEGFEFNKGGKLPGICTFTTAS